MTSIALESLIHEIPSETTPGERNLLIQLFSKAWSGKGTVVEIGPFLGGTTRAIALGMLGNPNRDPAARLHTFDRFDDYYTPANLRKMINPLVVSGSFNEQQAQDLCASGNFLGIFHAIHAPHAYGELICAHSSPLPDFPQEVAGSSSLSILDDDYSLSGLFIDGCKSWASTHYAMKFLLPRTLPGARLIFQDYGWYTCFWISAFVYAFRDKLNWHEHIDATYVFSLKHPITAAEIEAHFATTPDAMGAQFFKDSCLYLLQDSIARQDVRGALIAQLHFVAALATIGRKPDALKILKAIKPHEYGGLAGMILGSLKSPTYSPGNKPILWTDR